MKNCSNCGIGDMCYNSVKEVCTKNNFCHWVALRGYTNYKDRPSGMMFNLSSTDKLNIERDKQQKKTVQMTKAERKLERAYANGKILEGNKKFKSQQTDIIVTEKYKPGARSGFKLAITHGDKNMTRNEFMEYLGISPAMYSKRFQGFKKGTVNGVATVIKKIMLDYLIVTDKHGNEFKCKSKQEAHNRYGIWLNQLNIIERTGGVTDKGYSVKTFYKEVV